jgi:hypothetical protein
MKNNYILNVLIKLITFKHENNINKFEWYSIGILFYLILFITMYKIFFYYQLHTMY